jgi:hypothetical protein
MLRMLLSASLTVLLCPLAAAAPGPPQAPRVNPNASTLKEFTRRVNEYVALHKKLEDTLPALPKQTDPKQIDEHQRKLGALIQQARAQAKPGDLFFPAMQRLVRAMLRPIFTGADGRQIKGEILDNEFKGSVKLAVNGRYPDDVPISTVPPQVLAQLPKLSEELEYRFIQTNLILFDPHAHVIADYIVRAFQ